ncbi:MAG: NADH-quinone oxidoreductase subunit NuoH [Acidobacteria bacterium]|jgi:NADH-quinone oxidoreductase subunit H|nr:NADH-quinone oxidoreductase subunit NuoH [Acidobacteriota bacterium]MBA4122903.1 NADH-quinone oxidoreductase subunit NuoH [Acidobacteriota bacterium]MBA4184324.1 NADH-quinone oxidoreductase subunit NuoH [Acidobacteriota bacterium]
MEAIVKTIFPIAVISVGILLAFQGVLMIVAYTVLAERKVLGWIQGRIGPNRVGWWGVLQPFADLFKFIFKEDIVPDKSTKFVYFLAPIVALTCALLPIVVYPFGPAITSIDWSFLPYGLGDGIRRLPMTIAQIDVGVLFVLGITSVGVYGIALAGWSSNNKYSLMGGLRSSAQLISYELAMGASVIGVVMLAGTLDLNGIIFAQIQSPFRWFIIPQFIGFVVFLIAAFAETNRVPFDLPEAETELVAGFHTEYSALKFALFFMAEYVNMFTVSVMVTVLFLGGWYVPGLGWLGLWLANNFDFTWFVVGSIGYALVSHVIFIGKICAFLFLYIWIRGTLPRFRFDQLMNFGWKFLLPVALANVIVTILIVYFLNR